MSEHRITHTAVAPALAPQVWETLQTPLPWQVVAGIDEVVAPVIEAGQLVEFSFRSRSSGRSQRGSAVVVVSQPHHTMAVRLSSKDIDCEIRLLLSPSGTAATQLLVSMLVKPGGSGGKRAFGAAVERMDRDFYGNVERLAALTATGSAAVN